MVERTSKEIDEDILEQIKAAKIQRTRNWKLREYKERL